MPVGEVCRTVGEGRRGCLLSRRRQQGGRPGGGEGEGRAGDVKVEVLPSEVTTGSGTEKEIKARGGGGGGFMEVIAVWQIESEATGPASGYLKTFRLLTGAGETRLQDAEGAAERPAWLLSSRSSRTPGRSGGRATRP